MYVIYFSEGYQHTRQIVSTSISQQDKKTNSDDKQPLKKAKTPIGRLDDTWETKRETMKAAEENAYSRFPGNKNPETGEIDGPRGPEPTRYGDWERKGRVIDF